MSHDLRISARTETQNKFKIKGGSKLEVFDENGKLLHRGEFKSFTSNFLKLLYGSMIGAGTAKAKDLSNNNVEMNSFPQDIFILAGGANSKKYGVVVGTNTAAVSASDYNITAPANLTYGTTSVGTSSVGVDSISVEISRQISNSSGNDVDLKEVGLICGMTNEVDSNILIARDLLDLTLENGKKSVWRYTINFNFAADIGGFVQTFVDKMFSGLFEQITSSAPWTGREQAGCVVFQNKLWILGGYTGTTRVKDVWNTEDGVTWNRVTSSAGWSARSGFGCVVFQNKIWVLGGSNTSSNYRDVWNTEDGVTWNRVTSSAGWSARRDFGCVVFQNKLWILGGYTTTQVGDVWNTEDGVTWNRVTSSIGVVFNGVPCYSFNDDRLCVGYFNSTIISNDGVTWDNRVNNGKRLLSYGTYTIYRNKMWNLGGYGTPHPSGVIASKNFTSEIKLGSSDSAFSATGMALGAEIANGSGSGQLIYGAMPGTGTVEPFVSGNKTKFSIAREFTNNSGADITVREVGLFSCTDMLARLILAAPVTIANGESDVITVDFETEV